MRAMLGGNRPRGFALVIALSLMAFVLLLLLSVTTFVAVETNNPLSPLSDPSNGAPKRPTPKANS